jgi:DNA polymerase-3 subunit delta'
LNYKRGGYILISADIESDVQKIEDELKPSRVVKFVRDTFLVEDAKAVISEAYISESEVKYILLGANEFNNVSQNSLLKVLEEPPKNIEFIIISPTKSGLLPTVRSRMPIINGIKNKKHKEVELNFSRLSYEDIFLFLKSNARISKNEAKELVEAIYYRATVIDKLILNEEQLENFDEAYRLLELNSRPQSVLALILMGFVDAN